MEQFLATMIGKKVDISCGGGSSIRGEVLKVEGGVLHLKDTDSRMCFVQIDKIHMLWDARDDDHRAGFVREVSSE